jgi:archaemetzincin
VNAIYLAAIGNIDERIMKNLETHVWQVFGFDVKRATPLSEPAYAFHPERRQYSSAVILREILKQKPADALCIVGITEHDLFIPMLSFVFGLAQVNGGAAVISLARLRQEYYQLPANDVLLRSRSVKEMIHELGHTFGLTHCADLKCPMSLSNTIQHVDRKGEDLCENCSLILHETNRKYFK